MTGQSEARSFLDSVTGYGEPEHSEDTRPVRLATVDPAYSGTGFPKVLFDGESLMGLRGYPWAGLPPRAGERVVMLPQGRSYIIIGAVSAVPGASLPVGTSLEGHWTAAPTGFLVEDGSLQLHATYPQLGAVLGTRYNTGGETAAEFRLPDSRGRVAVAKAASGTFSTLGAKGGVESVVLTVAQLAEHQHASVASQVRGNATAGTNDVAGGSTYSFTTDVPTANTGSNEPHTNLQPYIVATRVIKY